MKLTRCHKISSFFLTASLTKFILYQPLAPRPLSLAIPSLVGLLFSLTRLFLLTLISMGCSALDKKNHTMRGEFIVHSTIFFKICMYVASWWFFKISCSIRYKLNPSYNFWNTWNQKWKFEMSYITRKWSKRDNKV